MTAKIIPNYPNYTITEDGEVRNIKRDKVIKHRNNSYGYKQVGLYKDVVRKNCLVHRLIYECFVLKDGEAMPETIDHKDGVRNNNSIINLRPATISENSRNRLIHRNKQLGHKNIYLTKCNTYKVEIRIDKGISYVKTHKTLPPAIEDADRVRLLYFGEFANNG